MTASMLQCGPAVNDLRAATTMRTPTLSSMARLLVVVAVIGIVGAGRAVAQPAPDAAPGPEPSPDAATGPDVVPSPEPPSPDVSPGAGAPPAVGTQPAAELAATPDVSHAPGPEDANGFERAPSTPAVNHLIWIPRIVLAVPRWGFWLVTQPIRLAAWAYEKYHLGYLYKHGLINIDDSFGITPTASYGGGYGLQVGARIVSRDVFGEQERLRLRASWGGEFSQAYGLEITTGERFGKHFRVELDARYERRPSDRFYGIGNGDVAGTTPPPMPIDPTVDSTAFSTRFREELVTGALTADILATKELGVRLSGAVMTREFSSDPMDPRSIELFYDPAGLVGYSTGLESAYIEGELRYDSRRRGSIYQSHALDATGWLASVYLGKKIGFDDDRSDFYRYGFEVQRYFDIFKGSRVLALRALVESVGGTDGTDGKISFVDLPRLGGLEDLRGYQTGRFRDRALTLVSAEYTWDLGNYLAAFLFVDAGRVWHSLRDVELAASGLRAGYGGGIQVHTGSSFVARAQLAVSREGELFFQFALSPAYGRRERAGRH
jgi:hypothetical protein